MKMVLNDISYSFQKIGEGPVLLFLHGFTGCKENWDGIAYELANQYTVLTIDLIGHGQTESPVDDNRYEIEAVCRDLALFLDRMEMKKVNILGYSMGGRVAVAFSILYPDRVESLILESSSPGIEDVTERNQRKLADERLANEIEQYGIDYFVEKWENIPLFQSQRKLPIEKQETIRKQRLRNKASGLANSLRGMGTGSQNSYWDRLCELQFPVLLICGEYDEKFCKLAEQMKKKIPQARIKKIIGAGHAIHVEEPDFFGKIVREFLQILTNKED